jgi:hypothetical protein
MKLRLGPAIFIWNGISFSRLFVPILINTMGSGKLYIGGGFGETKGPRYRDMCCVDLCRLDHGALCPLTHVARSGQAPGSAGTS